MATDDINTTNQAEESAYQNLNNQKQEPKMKKANPKPNENPNQRENEDNNEIKKQAKKGNEIKKRPRKVPEKKFTWLEKDFNKSLVKCQKISGEIDELKQKIKDKGFEDVNEADNLVLGYYKYSKAELAGLRNTLASKKAELRFERSKLRSLGDRYSKASRKNTVALKSQVRHFNDRNRLKNLAKKHCDEILKSLKDYIDDLIKAKDDRYKEINDAAKKHPQKVSSIVYKCIKKDVNDMKIADHNLFNLLAASPYIRTKIAQTVIDKINN